jgi:hypothetical protein
MPLLYLPDRREFFLWGDDYTARGLDSLASLGKPAVAGVVAPGKRTEVDGVALPLFETVARLAVIPAADMPTLSGSVATWALGSKLALDLVSRERVVPTVVRHGGTMQARWGAALSAPEDAAQVAALARSMPPSAHAVPAPGTRDRAVWAPEAILRAFLDATADALVRAARGAPELPASKRSQHTRHEDDHTPWEQRWRAALEGRDSTFETAGFAERTLAEDLRQWSQPALGARDRLRACFRLELPEADHDPFTLRFLLQSGDDPSLLVSAAEVWSTKGRSLAKLGRAFRDPQESLLEALGRAARLFAPVAQRLTEARPQALTLDPAAARRVGSGASELTIMGRRISACDDFDRSRRHCPARRPLRQPGS